MLLRELQRPVYRRIKQKLPDCRLAAALDHIGFQVRKGEGHDPVANGAKRIDNWASTRWPMWIEKYLKSLAEVHVHFRVGNTLGPPGELHSGDQCVRFKRAHVELQYFQAGDSTVGLN